MLAADIRYYGQRIRSLAYSKVGHLYPKGGPSRWRGVGSDRVPLDENGNLSNPACGAVMPLASSFKLGTKKGREVSVQPVVDRPTGKVRFTIVDGPAPEPTKLGRGAHFRCLACDEVADEAYIKAEASAARMGSTLMAAVVEGHRKRIYVAPEGVSLPEIERVDAEWLEAPMPNNPRWFSPPGFGLTTYDRLFTDRQLLALTTLAELVQEVRGESFAMPRRLDARSPMVSVKRTPTRSRLIWALL